MKQEQLAQDQNLIKYQYQQQQHQQQQLENNLTKAENNTKMLQKYQDVEQQNPKHQHQQLQQQQQQLENNLTKAENNSKGHQKYADIEQQIATLVRKENWMTSSISSTISNLSSESSLFKKEKKQANVEESVVVFADPSLGPSANLLCPLHRGFFVDPVIAKCGHTFCRSCLEKYIKQATKQLNECPLDKVVLKVDDLTSVIPNLVVADTISMLKIRCRYGCQKVNSVWVADPNGCPELVTWQKRYEHEDVCTYATTKCPYNPTKCGPIRKLALKDHIANCKNIPCSYKKLGCTFEGDKTQLNEHLGKCVYETMKGFIEFNQRKYDKIKMHLLEKEHENKQLKLIIAQLSLKLDNFMESIETKTSMKWLLNLS